MELWLKKQHFSPLCDLICQTHVVGCNQCCGFITKKKRPLRGARSRGVGPTMLSLGELHFGKLYKNLV